MSAQIAPAAAPAEELATGFVAEAEREQEETEGTEREQPLSPVPDDVDTELADRESATATEVADARQAAAERVRQSPGLLPGLRERLATVVAAGGEIDAAGRTLVSLDDALLALAESLPGALRLDEAHLQRPEHPGGGEFFRATPAGELSDDEAEEIARGQLARSGLLRGQRVRVAQDS